MDDERDHDLRLDVDATPLRAHRRLEDRASLHLRDLRIDNAKATPAKPEHRIRLAERLDDAIELVAREAERAREALRVLSAVREELVQRRVEQANRDGTAIHRLEDPLEVGTLHGEEFRQGAPASALIPGDDHLAHPRDPIALEEHVLGAAEPNALGPEVPRDAGVLRSVGVGAHLKCASFVGPRQKPRVGDIHARIRAAHLSRQHPNDIARDRGQITAEHAPRRAVEGDPFALVDRGAVDLEAAMLQVDLHLLAADDRALAHAARNDGGVARHSAARGEHRARGDHAVEILGRRLVADENHANPFSGALLRDIGIEHSLTTGGAGTRGKARRDVHRAGRSDR